MTQPLRMMNLPHPTSMLQRELGIWMAQLNGDTLIRCVWSNAPYPWAADVQGIVLEAGSALCTLRAKALGVHRAVCRCREGLEVQEALGKAVQPLWMDPGTMGVVPTAVMGCACGQGTR